ncbi:hypothetical protein D3C77_490010 [compost metagenome]
MLALRLVGLFQHHQVAQQIVEECRHEAQQRVRAATGENVVKFKLGQSLFALPQLAVFRSAAAIDVGLQGAEVIFVQATDDRDGQFHFNDLAQLIDLLAVELLKVQVIAQGAAGRFSAGFIEVGTAVGAGTAIDQTFNFQRLECFAGGALGAFKTLHQLALGG